MSNEKDLPSGNVNMGDNAQGNTIITGGVQGDVSINSPTPPKPPTPHQLRKPLDDFVGREKEIAELLDILLKGGRASLSGISGMGGIGKTELALIVADRLREDYPDAQVFLEMRGTDEKPLTPAEALASCIRAFEGLEVRLPDDVNELNKRYLSLLSGKRALVILDNAADRNQVRPLMPPAGCAMLVTSRNIIAGMERITLDQLKPEEARELLTSICDRISPEQADQIAYLCGYLPLAIRAAGSLLDVTLDLKPADYIKELTDERTRLEAIGTEDVDIGVEASFNLSYARLTPETARIFRCLSVFPHSFDARAEIYVCGDYGHKHLTELMKRSLTFYDEGNKRYRLHDLIRIFATNLSTKHGEQLWYQQRHAEHYLQVLSEANQLCLPGNNGMMEGLSLFDREWSNAQAAWKWIKKNMGSIPRALELCNQYPNSFHYIEGFRLHPRERIDLRQNALIAAQKFGRKDAQAANLGNLGQAYCDLGDFGRSIEIYEQALAIAREIGDRHVESQLLVSLSNAYGKLGETQRAIEYLEQSLSLSRQIGNPVTKSQILNNLGIAYIELGQFQRSIEVLEESLLIKRKCGNIKDEGATLGNLGNAYRKLGNPERAIEFYQQDLAISRNIGDRGGEGQALWNLAAVFNDLGDQVQAIKFAEAALIIKKQIESPDAPMVRNALEILRGEGGAANE